MPPGNHAHTPRRDGHNETQSLQRSDNYEGRHFQPLTTPPEGIQAHLRPENITDPAFPGVKAMKAPIGSSLIECNTKYRKNPCATFYCAYHPDMAAVPEAWQPGARDIRRTLDSVTRVNLCVAGSKGIPNTVIGWLLRRGYRRSDRFNAPYPPSHGSNSDDTQGPEPYATCASRRGQGVAATRPAAPTIAMPFNPGAPGMEHTQDGEKFCRVRLQDQDRDWGVSSISPPPNGLRHRQHRRRRSVIAIARRQEQLRG